MTQLVLPIALLTAALLWIFFTIILNNLNSKDVVFSYTALVAASVMFCLNIGLSLKTSQEETIITVVVATSEGTTDVLNNINKSNFMVVDRDKISRSLGIHSPSNVQADFNKDFTELTSRLNKFLLIGVIGQLLETTEQWGAKKQQFKNSTFTTIPQDQTINNTIYTAKKIAEKLLSANIQYNLMDSDSIFHNQNLVLPPNSHLIIHNEKIIIENPFLLLTISFSTAPSYNRLTNNWTDEIDNQTPIAFESNIHLVTVYKKLRDGNQRKADYKNWVRALTNDLNNGFSALK